MSGQSIGFLLHPREAHECVDAAQAIAQGHGLTTWTASNDAARVVGTNLEGCRLLVTVGGDGTFLLGARIAGPQGVPVLGVNRGQLGFLTGIEIDQLPGALDTFLRGAHRTQRRSLLALTVPGCGPDGGDLGAVAVNEVVVKSAGTNLCRLRVDADGEVLGEFDADGVIIATATGSTAYALSAGGPPVDPRVRAVVVVPLAPFAVLTRPVILPEMTVLWVTLVRGRAFAAADGHLEVAIPEGTRLSVEPGADLQVVTVEGSPTFLQRLREKMRLGTPLKHPGAMPEARPPAPGRDG